MLKKIFLLFCIFANVSFAKPIIVEQAFKSVTLSGYTRSYKKAVITPEVSGKVIKFNYKIGENIDNKPLVEIDKTFIQLDINNIDYQLKKNEIEIKKIKSKIRFLKKDFERKKKLKIKGRASEISFDTAQQNLEQAELTFSTLLITQSILRTNLKKLTERLKRYDIIVPQGWILTNKFAEQLEMVSPSKPIAEIRNYEYLTIPLSVSSNELEEIKRLKIIRGTLNDTTVKAKINYINPRYNEKTKKTDIELIIKNSNKELRGGMLFKFNLKIKIDAYKINKNAIDYGYEYPRVYPAGLNHPVNVEIIESENNCEIIKKTPKLKPGTELKNLNQ